MKIGRFAVAEKYKGTGIGTMIIDYIKQWFISNNRTGCKYITVDVYSKSLTFYSRNGFNYLTETDISSDTRVMYFDLSLMKL